MYAAESALSGSVLLEAETGPLCNYLARTVLDGVKAPRFRSQR